MGGHHPSVRSLIGMACTALANKDREAPACAA